MQDTVQPKGKGKGRLEAVNDNNCGVYVSALCMLRLWLRGTLKHRPSFQPTVILRHLFTILD